MRLCDAAVDRRTAGSSGVRQHRGRVVKGYVIRVRVRVEVGDPMRPIASSRKTDTAA